MRLQLRFPPASTIDAVSVAVAVAGAVGVAGAIVVAVAIAVAVAAVVAVVVAVPLGSTIKAVVVTSAVASAVADTATDADDILWMRFSVTQRIRGSRTSAWEEPLTDKPWTDIHRQIRPSTNVLVTEERPRAGHA